MSGSLTPARAFCYQQGCAPDGPRGSFIVFRKKFEQEHEAIRKKSEANKARRRCYEEIGKILCPGFRYQGKPNPKPSRLFFSSVKEWIMERFLVAASNIFKTNANASASLPA